MSKFGTGCCTGGYKFAGNAGWKPPTGGGWNPPTGDAMAQNDSSCDPLVIPDVNDISFGTTGLDWPRWMKKSGCGTIAIFTLNEKTFDLTGILTPEHAEEFADCVNDCLVRTGLRMFPVEFSAGIRSGVSNDMIPCLNECKEDFMAGHYEISTDVSTVITTNASGYGKKDFSGYDPSTVLSSLCPPLCRGQLVVISFQMLYNCWKWNPVSKSWTGPREVRGGHRVQCEIISCPPPDADPPASTVMCFKCINREPQIAMETFLCMSPDGSITYRQERHGGLSQDVGQPGSCKKKFKNPSYGGYMNPQCCEFSYARGPVKNSVTTITFDTPCPDGKDE